MKYHAYPAYKDSGVEWLGDVPEHWDVTRVKFESYVKARVGWHGLKSDDFTDEGAYLVTGQDFIATNINWDNCYHCDLERYEQDPYIQLREDDLLITKDGTIGKVALVQNLNGQATLNSGIFVVRPLADNYTNIFYFWLLQSNAFTSFVDFNKTGSTIVHLYQDTFVNFKYAMPYFNEQTQIANFLDHETAKIDTLIEKQRRLIELLKEKRQAVISHAVTKGLNPNAPMKDSGVEWLGDVPEHWDISALKRKCSLLKDGTHLPPARVDNGIPLLSVRNIQDGVFSFRDDDSMISKESYQELCKAFVPKTNDVLLAIVGATLGKTALIPDGFGEFHIQRSVGIFRPSIGIVSKWLNFVFQSQKFQQLLWEYVGFSAQPGIYLGTLGEFKIPIPPLSEQYSIISLLDNKTAKIDTLIEKANSAIELMQERRTALISAAVTGKIDVRDWQAVNKDVTG